MKTPLFCFRAWCALGLVVLIAGCATSEKTSLRTGRNQSERPVYRRVALPTVTVVLSCNDGPITAAETSEVMTFMSDYFSRRGKVLIDNPLQADFVAKVVVARNGAVGRIQTKVGMGRTIFGV